MKQTLLIIFRMSQAYWVNTIIYRLRELPLIKNILKPSAYASKDLKFVVSVLTAAMKTAGSFGFKLLYMLVMVMLPAAGFQGSMQENYFTIVIFLSVVGAFANTEMFNPTKEKFYAVTLMHVDSCKYARASYVWFLLKTAVTFLVASLLIGSLAGVPVLASLLLPLFITAVKILGSAIQLKVFEKTEIALSENKGKFVWSVILTGTALAYGLPFLQCTLPLWAFYVLAFAGILIAVPGFLYLWKSRLYRRMYKKLLTMNNIIFSAKETSSQQQQQKRIVNQISYEETKTGNKTGYEYFNAVFTQRHKKILTKSANTMTLALAGVLLLAVAGTRISTEFSDSINHLMLSFLPYFVFIMYVLNRGTVVTQAMFLNCDRSMLTYRFYRQPDTILSLFKVRLKTLVWINLKPALVIALGLPLLLFLTGGTKEPLNYILLMVSVPAMSVFFSVHHLMLYYLLQPYNVNMESKSSMYKILNVVTYMFCYVFIQVQAPTIVFASMTILFTAVYIGIALLLVYRYAPKRFHLKQ